jgi:hypothetical protein
MNISIFGTKDWEAEYMKGKISGFSTEAVVNFFDGIVTPEKLPPEETEILCNFVDSLVNKEVIDKLSEYIKTMDTDTTN